MFDVQLFHFGFAGIVRRGDRVFPFQFSVHARGLVEHMVEAEHGAGQVGARIRRPRRGPVVVELAVAPQRGIGAERVTGIRTAARGRGCRRNRRHGFCVDFRHRLRGGNGSGAGSAHLLDFGLERGHLGAQRVHLGLERGVIGARRQGRRRAAGGDRQCEQSMFHCCILHFYNLSTDFTSRAERAGSALSAIGS